MNGFFFHRGHIVFNRWFYIWNNLMFIFFCVYILRPFNNVRCNWWLPYWVLLRVWHLRSHLHHLLRWRLVCVVLDLWVSFWFINVCLHQVSIVFIIITTNYLVVFINWLFPLSCLLKLFFVATWFRITTKYEVLALKRCWMKLLLLEVIASVDWYFLELHLTSFRQHFNLLLLNWNIS